MDTLNLCWRGMAGSGKRRALHTALATIASARGIPFSLNSRPLATAPEEASGDDDAPPDMGQIMVETSLVHMGLDVARMSMQDKQVLKPVFAGLGQGSQVLSGASGRGSRILVLYHAHLLSSESVLLLQSCLEMNEGDISIWMTSEMPVPQRIRDWVVELPVVGEDKAFQAFKADAGSTLTEVAHWPLVFGRLIAQWASAPRATIESVKEIKGFVYEMLMRNLRWVEAVHYMLDAVLTSPCLTATQRLNAVTVLASCDATAGGYTIPSYRIPILWESLFLSLRNIIQPVKQGDAPTRPKRISKSSRGITSPASGTVA